MLPFNNEYKFTNIDMFEWLQLWLFEIQIIKYSHMMQLQSIFKLSKNGYIKQEIDIFYYVL